MKTGIKLFLLIALIATVPAWATNYGKPLSNTPAVKVSELIPNADKYVGMTVKVEGIITDVCEKRGCWMIIAGDREFQSVRFKVDDGVIVIPLEAKGKKAIAEGTFKKIEMTQEQALEYTKHIAVENNRPFDPKSVDGPLIIFQINGTGVVIE